MTEKIVNSPFHMKIQSILSIFLQRVQQPVLFVRQWQTRKARIKRFLRRVQGERKKMLIAESDYYRLLNALRREHARGGIHRKVSARLRYLLNRSVHLPLRLVPEDMITMNTRFLLCSHSGKQFVLTLVYPEDADKSKGNIPVVSHLGISLLGRQIGEYIRDSLFVSDILYQPESRNDFHL